ncbi:MAG: DUF3991 and TOPRIM domain-containing protein [Oscillospiraceae bacterium]
MDLLTYLQNYEPQELVYVSGNIYCTKTHDSLRISNGKWCWFSRGIGGKSALDYLIKVNGFSFTEAVEQITGRAAIKPPVFVSAEKEKPKVLLLPKASRSATPLVSYLHSRGIDDELIDYCIKTGRLYESSPHHNAVFIGFDKGGTAKYATLRGIGTDFKGEANGSDKHYSFSLPAAQPNEIVHLFESAIDVLSYATLLKQYGRQWQNENLLSLAGIYQPKKVIEESRMPAALTRFLEDYPHIRRITLHLDNDYPGRMAEKAIMTIMPKDYTVINKPPPYGKDFNDYLLAHLKSRCSTKGVMSDERI